MNCAHCCGNYTSVGEHMSFEVFKTALNSSGDFLAIGGGEPTLHPEFEKFIFYALGTRWVDDVWLATNGSLTEKSLALAEMARKGILGVALSQDEYHDPIDQEVICEFNDNIRGFDRDRREIRNVSNSLANAGRCDFGKDVCPCCDVMILPNGDVKYCGCDDAPIIGNIMKDGYETPDFECYKDQLEHDKKQEEEDV